MGATILLFSGMFAACISFIIVGVSGSRLHKNKSGAKLLMITIAIIILFCIGWVFKVVQLAGADMLLSISVLSLILMFSFLSIYFKRNGVKNNILTYLHERNNGGIERFIVGLLMMGGALKLVSIYVGYPSAISSVIIVFAICVSGLHLLALIWRLPGALNSNFDLISVVLSFIIFMIPALGRFIPFEMRVVLMCLFFIITSVILFKNDQVIANNILAKLCLIILPLFWTLWSASLLAEIEIIPFLFNVPLLFLFVSLMISQRRNPLLLGYLSIHLGNYFLNMATL